MSVNTAPIKWAQRKESVYITITLADVKNESIDISSKSLAFTGVSGDKEYKLDLVFVSIID